MSGSDSEEYIDSSASLSTDAVLTSGYLSHRGNTSSNYSDQSAMGITTTRPAPEPAPRGPLRQVDETEQYYRIHNLGPPPGPDGPGSASAGSASSGSQGHPGGRASMPSSPPLSPALASSPDGMRTGRGYSGGHASITSPPLSPAQASSDGMSAGRGHRARSQATIMATPSQPPVGSSPNAVLREHSSPSGHVTTNPPPRSSPTAMPMGGGGYPSGHAPMGPPQSPTGSSPNSLPAGGGYHRNFAREPLDPGYSPTSSASGGVMASPDHFYNSRRPSTVDSVRSGYSAGSESEWSASNFSSGGMNPRALDFGATMGSNESLHMMGQGVPGARFPVPGASPPALRAPFQSQPTSPLTTHPGLAPSAGPPLPPQYDSSTGLPRGYFPPGYVPPTTQPHDPMLAEVAGGWQAAWQNHAAQAGSGNRTSLPAQQSTRQYDVDARRRASYGGESGDVTPTGEGSLRKEDGKRRHK